MARVDGNGCDPGRRVVITGVGVTSPLGCGRHDFWRALCDGRSGVVALDGRQLPRLGGAVTGFVAKDFIASHHLRRMDRLSRMIVAAARMALLDAKLDATTLAPGRVAITVGTAFGNSSETESHIRRLFGRGPSAVSPMIFPNLVANAPASYVAMELGAMGPNLTVSQLEVSGEYAIGLAFDTVRSGRADVALAGGGDELTMIVTEAYRSTHALSAQRGGVEWSSPYDAARSGVVLGEGAAMLVLEPFDRAVERGVPILAEIESVALFSIPAPAYDWPWMAEEATATFRALVPEFEADVVCGGANSSRRLDQFELELFDRLLGGSSGPPWLTSLKGATGEFGAAGALTTVEAALSLYEQIVPPLCHLRQLDGDSALRPAAPRGMSATLRRALVAGFARGGAAAAITLRHVTS